MYSTSHPAWLPDAAASLARADCSPEMPPSYHKTPLSGKHVAKEVYFNYVVCGVYRHHHSIAAGMNSLKCVREIAAWRYRNYQKLYKSLSV